MYGNNITKLLSITTYANKRKEKLTTLGKLQFFNQVTITLTEKSVREGIK
jgi:hypothetical protein